MANKHLTYDDRNTIESMLKHKTSFREIGKVLDKDPSTISKEIQLHRYAQCTCGKYINYNASSSYAEVVLCVILFAKTFSLSSAKNSLGHLMYLTPALLVIIALLKNNSILLRLHRKLIARPFLKPELKFLYLNLKSNI